MYSYIVWQHIAKIVFLTINSQRIARDVSRTALDLWTKQKEPEPCASWTSSEEGLPVIDALPLSMSACLCRSAVSLACKHTIDVDKQPVLVALTAAVDYWPAPAAGPFAASTVCIVQVSLAALVLLAYSPGLREGPAQVTLCMKLIACKWRYATI